MYKKTITLIFALILMTTIRIYIDHTYVVKVKEHPVGGEKKTSYCIFVEVEDKTLYLLEDGKCIRKYPISSGASGSPSPLGFWKITNKGDWGEGFGGRWMGLNVPWGTLDLEHI